MPMSQWQRCREPLGQLGVAWAAMPGFGDTEAMVPPQHRTLVTNCHLLIAEPHDPLDGTHRRSWGGCEEPQGDQSQLALEVTGDTGGLAVPVTVGLLLPPPSPLLSGSN